MTKLSKVLLALLLVLVMVFSVACGEGEDTNKDSDGGKGNSSSESGKNDKNDGDNDADKGDDDTDKGDGDKDDDEITVQEQVVFENDSIKVTVTGYEDTLMGPELKLQIENNYDKKVTVTTEMVSVCDYMMDSAGMWAEVEAGKKANEAIAFYDSELEDAGIPVLNDIQFRIVVADADTWDEMARSDLLTITTSAGEMRKPELKGTVIYDKNGIKITHTGLEEDIIWGGELGFQVENNSGRDITIDIEDASANDFMLTWGAYMSLRTSTRMVNGMSIDLEEVGLDSIDDIEKVEFKITITDSETWEEIDSTDVISLTF